MTYAERRAAAIALADDYEGWSRPPVPDVGRCRGRVLMMPRMVRGKKLIGLIPFDSLVENEFAAKEKRQNREKFK